MDNYSRFRTQRSSSYGALLCAALALLVITDTAPFRAQSPQCAQVAPDQGEIAWELPAPRTQSSFEQQVLALQPLGYWRFLTSAAVVDEAGNAHGSYAGPTVTTTTGPLAAGASSAVSLDASLAQHVDIPHAPAFTVDRGSIMLWVRPDGTLTAGKKSGLFSKDSSAQDSGGQITLWYRGSNDFRVRLQSTTTSYFVESADNYFPGRWHHVAVTFGDNGLRLYVNGQLADVDEYTGGLGASSGGAGNHEPIVLGASADRSDDLASNRLEDFFGGELAEVTLLATELSAAQIAALLETRFPLFSDYADAVLNRGPAAFYRLADDGNASLLDAVGGTNGGNNGEYLGATTGAQPGAVAGDTSVHFGATSFARVDTPTALQISGDLSIGLWVRPETLTGTLLECAGVGTGTAQHSLYRLALRPDGITYGHEHAFGAVEVAFTQALSAGSWLHVAIVRTVADGRVELYLNGQRVDSVEGLPAPTGGSNADLLLGVGVLNGTQFVGDLDEVALFTRALDAQEVALLANAEAGRSVRIDRDGEALAWLPWTEAALIDLPVGPGPFDYCVRAIDNGLELPAACCSLRMLQQPADFLCVEQGDGVELSWVAGEPYASIEIDRDGTLIATLPGDATTFQDSSALPGQQQYTLRPFVESEAAPTAECTAHVELAPTNFSCAIDGDQATLSWVTPRSYDTTLIYRDQQLVATLPGTTHAYTLVGLAAGSHTFQVAGELNALATSTATCDALVLPAPADFSGCNENSGITLSWMDPVGYDTVELRRNGTLIAIVPGNLSSYYFAADGNGGHVYEARGRAAGVASLATSLTSITLLAPENLNADIGSTCGALASIRLEWTNADAYDAIELWKDGSLAANLSGTTTTFSDLVVVETATLVYSVVGIRGGAECGRRGADIAVDLHVPAQLAGVSFPDDYEACAASASAIELAVTTPEDATLYTYEWRHDGTLLPTTGPTLSIPSTSSVDGGDYTVIVDNGCDSVTHTVVVALLDDHVITAENQDDSLCVGETTTLTVAVSGIAPTLQWFVDGQLIAGATSDTLTVAAAPAAASQSYSVEVTDLCSTTTTAIAQITTLTMPTLTQTPPSIELCSGDTTTLTVAATGNSLTYQWSVDGNAIPGATSTTLALIDVSLADAGSYTVTINAPCGSVTTDPAIVAVGEGPTITTQPLSQSFCTGEAVSLHVEVLVGALASDATTIQWRHNGTPITGATSPTLTLATTSMADAGSYDAVVTNGCTSVTTFSAELTALTAPVVTTQPQDSSACDGASVTFAITATGTAPLHYQWLHDGNPIAGATTDSLTVTASAATAGAYSVHVTNECGEQHSGIGALSLATPTTINTAPSSLVACPNGDATLTVEASGDGTLTYQWFHNGNPVATNSATLQLPGLTAEHAGNYHVEVSGACGVAVSDSASVTVLAAPQISVSPADSIACPGGELVLGVTASGDDLTYTWRRNGTPIQGATAATLTLSNIAAADVGSYDVQVSNQCGTATSQVAVVTLATQPLITMPTFDVDLCDGETALLQVNAIGAGQLTYTWFHNGNLLQETGSTLQLLDVTATNAGVYEVQVTGPCGTVASSATVTVNDAPVITTQPTGATLCADESAALTVAATGTDLSYQWFVDGEPVLNATAPQLLLPNVVAAHSGDYWVTISSACGTTTSVVATLNVVTPPTITTHPQSRDLCVGDSVTFEVVATGTGPMTYTWHKDGAALESTNAPSLVLDTLTVADAGEYTVTVGNSCGVVESASALLEAASTTTILQQPQPQLVCAGDSFTLVVAAIGPELTYQWRRDGVELAGATLRTLAIGQASNIDAGAYDVIVSGRCGNVISDEAFVTVDQAPRITDSPSDLQLSIGESSTFSVSATGTGPFDYQWYFDGTPIVGATEPSLALESFALTDVGSYFVVVSNRCDSVASAAFTVAQLLPSGPFRRGDANDDGGVNTADAIFLLNYLFANAAKPACMDAADVDDNGSVNLSDAIQLLNYLFAGAFAPAAPFTSVGFDPTDDDLPCHSSQPAN
ncbi:MAG: immunoglobulin domain-containing protein [Planctomycetota bacterium]